MDLRFSLDLHASPPDGALIESSPNARGILRLLPCPCVTRCDFINNNVTFLFKNREEIFLHEMYLMRIAYQYF